MTTEPLLSPADLHRLRACNPDRRLADTRAAGWANDQGRRLREWAALPRADGKGPSAPLGDIAWAMMRIDPRRWGRAMAAVLEAMLLPDADPRSLAVIALLRGEDWSGAAWAAAEAGAAAAWAATAAAWAATAAAWAAAEAEDGRGAAAAAEARRGAAAARARPDLDITTIMLDSWEKE